MLNSDCGNRLECGSAPVLYFLNGEEWAGEVGRVLDPTVLGEVDGHSPVAEFHGHRTIGGLVPRGEPTPPQHGQHRTSVPESETLPAPSAPLMLFRLASGELAVVSDHADGNVIHEDSSHDMLSSQATAALAASLPLAFSLEVLRKLI